LRFYDPEDDVIEALNITVVLGDSGSSCGETLGLSGFSLFIECSDPAVLSLENAEFGARGCLNASWDALSCSLTFELDPPLAPVVIERFLWALWFDVYDPNATVFLQPLEINIVLAARDSSNPGAPPRRAGSSPATTMYAPTHPLSFTLLFQPLQDTAPSFELLLVLGRT